MLVLKSEDLFDVTTNTLERVLDFLEISRWTPEAYSIPNKSEYTGVEPFVRQRLAEYYEPFNQQLYDYLGVDFGW